MPLGDELSMDIGFKIDVMPGLVFFTPQGFWAKLDPDNWAGALGMSIRPLATASLKGFKAGNDSYPIEFKASPITLDQFSDECGEGVTCTVDLQIDVSGGGTIDVNGDEPLEAMIGVQGTLVGRALGITNFDGPTAAAIVKDFQGFDRITGGSLNLTITPDLGFSVGLGVPSSVADLLQGWLGEGDLASLAMNFEIPLELSLNMNDLIGSEQLSATLSAQADVIPELEILPGTPIHKSVDLGTIQFGIDTVNTPNILPGPGAFVL